MTSTGRSADSRRIRRGPAQWLLGLLLALAIGASIAMMFSNSRSIAASLAVISALWAAVIGAILVTKFRRQADSAESKARDLRLVYELQLEREITARRQYELGVETQIRKEVHAETNEELGELKTQVEALRASLELLVGGDLPEQRAALKSDRRRELDRARSRTDSGYSSPQSPPYASADATFDDGAVAERDFASTAPEVRASHVPVAEPHSMTEVIPVVTDDAREAAIVDTAPRADDRVGVPSRHGAAAEQSGEADVPVFVDETPTDEWAVAPAEVIPDLSADAPVVSPVPAAGSHATTPAPSSYIGGRHGRSATPVVEVTPEPEPTPEPVAAVAPEPFAPEPSAPAPTPRVNDRHRAPDPEPGAHQAGRSVSELIDQLRAGGGGGRRRRSED